MRTEKVTILSASFHRNGIGALGFYAIIFDSDHGRMIASLFDDAGACAVYQIDELAKGNIEFAEGNSWRGDVFEDALRPALKAYLEAQGTNRVGPFAL